MLIPTEDFPVISDGSDQTQHSEDNHQPQAAEEQQQQQQQLIVDSLSELTSASDLPLELDLESILDIGATIEDHHNSMVLTVDNQPLADDECNIYEFLSPMHIDTQELLSMGDPLNLFADDAGSQVTSDLERFMPLPATEEDYEECDQSLCEQVSEKKPVPPLKLELKEEVPTDDEVKTPDLMRDVLELQQTFSTAVSFVSICY